MKKSAFHILSILHNQNHCRITRNVLLCFLLGLSCNLLSQQIVVPYSCGFEDANENSNWVLNSDTQTSHDKWIIGEATHSEGTHSLYISNDGGEYTAYGDRPNTIIAYRLIQFQPTDSTLHYDLSFDWKCLGEEKMSEMYVFFDNYSDENKALLTTSTESGDVLSDAAVKSMRVLGANNSKALYGQTGWKNSSIRIDLNKVSSKFTFILAFIWVNRNKDIDIARSRPLGGCIDNIQICSSKAPRPNNLSAQVICQGTNDLKLTWTSSLENFILEYKDANDDRWNVIQGLQADQIRDNDDPSRYSFTLENLAESLYDVRIKGMIGQEVSPYSYLRNVQLYCWDNRCINYIDLTGPKTVCTTGRYFTGIFSPFDSIGVVDYGPDAAESRHTVHWEKNVYDVRTINTPGFRGIKTVPDGYMAAVRLGNWKAGGQAETITYEFEVDSTDHAILLVKYALVIQWPNELCMDPGFLLEIIDGSTDESLNDDCKRAEFTYQMAKEADWNCSPQTEGGALGPGAAFWKDWTTIGINLTEHHGKKMKVRFRTRDCAAGGHYAYCYFVVDCTSAKLVTESCGDIPVFNVSAPDGFNYTWYDSHNHVVSNEQTLSVSGGDSQRYTCDVCFQESSECCFNLSTVLAPRYPRPQFTTDHTPKDCKNTVHFHNNSYIAIDADTVQYQAESSNMTYLWKIRSLNDPEGKIFETTKFDPTYNCDVNGDLLEVSLDAFMNNGLCTDNLTDTIVVPNISTQDTTLHKEICAGSFVDFGGEWRTESGLYSVNRTNNAGCSYTISLDLTVHPTTGDIMLSDTICTGGAYYVDSKPYTQSGNYEIFLKNTHGCDSIVNLNLTVIDRLVVEVDSLPPLCADGNFINLHLNILEGSYDSILISFDDKALSQGFRNITIIDKNLTDIPIPFTPATKPDIYNMTLEFYQKQSCGNNTTRVPFIVQYPSSIIAQRWNDVLGIKNKDNNGGYDFVSFQWLKDGIAIEGATLPYLYLPEGLDMNATYSALVKRDDGTEMMTCPVTPQDLSGDDNIPTLIKPKQQISRHQSGAAMWTSSTGTLVHRQHYDSQIIVPDVSYGFYILTLYENEHYTTTKVLVIDDK